MSIFSDTWNNNRLKPRVPTFRSLLASANEVSLSVSGVGATTGNSPAIIDLEEGTVEYHEGNLVFEVSTQNGQGGTPTSPGAAVNINFKVGFFTAPDTGATPPLVAADAPTVLATLADLTTLTCLLPNSSSAAVAGFRIYRTATLPVRGRFLAYWYDKDAFAANAVVLVKPRIVRI